MDRDGSRSQASGAVRRPILRFAIRVLRTGPPVSDGRPRRVEGTTISLQPAKTIEGRVLAADTGGPIGDAVIAVRAQFSEFHSGSGAPDSVRTIEDGSRPTRRQAISSIWTRIRPTGSLIWSLRSSSRGPRVQLKRRSTSGLLAAF